MMAIRFRRGGVPVSAAPTHGAATTPVAAIFIKSRRVLITGNCSSKEFISCRSLFLPRLPLQTGPVHSKLYQPSVFHFCHVRCTPVRTPKADVAGKRAEYVNLAQLVTAGSKFHYGPFAVPGDAEISIHITAHPVQAMLVELFEKMFVG